MSAHLRDLTLPQLWDRIGRYRPLLVTVVLTLGALRLAPGTSPQVPELLASPAAGPVASPAAPPPVAAPRTGAAPSVDTDGRPVNAPSPRPAPSPSIPGTPAPTVTAPAAAPPVVPVVPGEPSTVRHTGWATLDAGTPLAALGVPEGSLPVANRLGQLARASFVLLDGPWELLVLDVDPDGSSVSLDELALQACAITTAGWAPAEAQHFNDAPRWSDDCTQGVLVDGRWSFAVDQIEGEHGVALVPGEGAPLDFTVSLRSPQPATRPS